MHAITPIELYPVRRASVNHRRFAVCSIAASSVDVVVLSLVSRSRFPSTEVDEVDDVVTVLEVAATGSSAASSSLLLESSSEPSSESESCSEALLTVAYRIDTIQFGYLTSEPTASCAISKGSGMCILMRVALCVAWPSPSIVDNAICTLPTRMCQEAATFRSLDASHTVLRCSGCRMIRNTYNVGHQWVVRIGVCK
jgi:hypothetical protein